VTVELPDERTAKARVVAVGRNLAPTEDGSPNAPKLTVTVTVNDPRTIAKLDSADVDVRFVGRTAKDVLVAPIEALVALREGGYAVQAPSGLVGVRTGMFADGWVEITGDGLAEGTEVVVSS
jgi:multidrug efflux pump subunit AcrA (membrane-fusion protein)